MLAGSLPAKEPALTGERLVEEAQAFSQEAWAQIYDQFYMKIFDYCCLRTGNRAASEDLASEVFLEALRGIRRYRYRGLPFSAWLYRIARNITADHLQRNARRPTVELVEDSGHPALQTPDQAEGHALSQDMQAAIRQLTEDQQQVITLRFFQGLSHEETAAIMGRRSGAVRVLQNRALHALRKHMAAGA
jgi:RNA polymerase sigma-70 factor (ECF subfamily)